MEHHSNPRVMKDSSRSSNIASLLKNKRFGAKYKSTSTARSEILKKNFAVIGKAVVTPQAAKKQSVHPRSPFRKILQTNANPPEDNTLEDDTVKTTICFSKAVLFIIVGMVSITAVVAALVFGCCWSRNRLQNARAKDCRNDPSFQADKWWSNPSASRLLTYFLLKSSVEDEDEEVHHGDSSNSYLYSTP